MVHACIRLLLKFTLSNKSLLRKNYVLIIGKKIKKMILKNSLYSVKGTAK